MKTHMILRILLLVLLNIMFTNFTFAQNKKKNVNEINSTVKAPDENGVEKKPTLMLLPSDNWCTQRFFTQTFDNQGIKVRIPDYQRAFQEDIELKNVLAKVRELLISRGYSVKDCAQELNNIATKTAEDNVTMSKTSGASLTESPLDMLKRRTKADRLIKVDWNVNKSQGSQSVTFILEAVDTYTSKNIASVSGTGPMSNNIIASQLEAAIENHINSFDSQMTMYYNDLEKKGREIVFTVRCWDSWDNDLETEYDGEELVDCIQNWMRKNTVNGSFNLSDGTENFAQFEQVRIPFFDANGNAMDARAFATMLRKYLAKEPYFITAKVMVRGLGEAIIVLGEK
ncbi:MAG: hypothetical protein J6X43_08125 [Bacteroidales bacterium]|nr:hypothetical protein [Bacteroidales bacterium]